MAPLLSVADLERLLATAETRARREFLSALLRVRQQLPLSALEQAIVARQLDEALRLVGLEPVLNALAEIRLLTDEVRRAGWFEGLRGLPSALLRQPLLQLALGADAQANSFPQAALERQSLARIQAITQETQGAVRLVLARGLQTGTPPRALAREIRQIVGLTRGQAAGVLRYRERLVAQGRPPEQVGRMADRFARRQLTQRADTIARTETFTALHQGKRAQWERLQREGIIQATDWEGEWVTANDERVCPICAPLDGQRAPMGQPIGGYEPPAHPRCRCVVRLTLAGFRRGQPTNRFRRAAA